MGKEQILFGSTNTNCCIDALVFSRMSCLSPKFIALGHKGDGFV